MTGAESVGPWPDLPTARGALQSAERAGLVYGLGRVARLEQQERYKMSIRGIRQQATATIHLRRLNMHVQNATPAVFAHLREALAAGAAGRGGR